VAIWVATLVLFALAATLGWLERGFLVSLPSRSLGQRLWVLLPGVLLAVLAFAVAVRQVGLLGIPLAVLSGILAFEVWGGLSWYHAWVGGFWMRTSRRTLESNPDFEASLTRSKVGKLIIHLTGREEK
jgi:hypothetical protein